MGHRRWAGVAVGAVMVLAPWVAPIGARAQTLPPGPSTSHVTVAGSAVSALITRPLVDFDYAAGAEFFIDAVGRDGSGTPMSAPTTPNATSYTATGTLPGGLIGTHTVFVHGVDTNHKWGATDWATFTGNPPTVTAGWAKVTVTQDTSNYTVALHPGDPIIPSDPYFVVAVGFALPSLASFGFARTPISVPAGTINVDTITINGPPITPPDPDAVEQQGPPIRVAVVSIDATNGFTYTATPTFSPILQNGPPIRVRLQQGPPI